MHNARITFDYVGMLIVFLHGKPRMHTRIHYEYPQSMPNCVTNCTMLQNKLCPCQDNFEHFKTVGHFTISGNDEIDPEPSR